MSLPVTVLTVAFGSPDVVREWALKWSDTGALCLISDNGNLVPSDISGKVEILPFTGNSGFGGGINRAVRESDTPIVLITNPDTFPENSKSLDSLFQFHSRGSLTGGMTFDSRGNEIHSTGIWPSKSWVKSQVFKSADTLWRKDRMDWLQGSLIMVHKDDFQKIGGFNERFPLYFEDVDICSKAKRQGLSINFCRESRFIHDEGSGADKATATRLSCFHWGLLEFFKNHDPANANAVRKMIATKCILRLAAYAVINPEAAKGYYKALQSVLSGVAPKLPGALNG